MTVCVVVFDRFMFIFVLLFPYKLVFAFALVFVFVFDNCSINFQDFTCLKVQPGLKPIHGKVELHLEKSSHLLIKWVEIFYILKIFLG